MKKLLAILISILLCAMPALADHGTADVVMEGKTYHLTLDSIGIVDGKLTVAIEGFGDTLRWGANGPMIAGLPEARYGDETVNVSTVNMNVGAAFTFIFERDDMPDEIWMNSYDKDTEPALIWQAGDDVGGAEAGAPAASNIPSELVGTWQGVGTPKNGGHPIDLTITITAEGTGEYTFDQGSYHESYPFTLSNDDSTFSVDIPATSQLGSVGGTWALEGDTLKLDITSTFTGGGSYSYTAECQRADAPAEAVTPEPTAEPTPEPTPEPTAEPTPEPTPEPAGEAPVDEILNALDDEVYRATYDALVEGTIIQKGSKGDAAKGLQQTLIAFGQSIAADGSVGPKTIGALNAVQAAFGLEQTDTLDAGGYAELLPRLLIAIRPDEAGALLEGHMDAAEIDYMRACAYVAGGKFYSARKAFESSGFGDWEERAAACVQSWPKTGQLYKNPSVKGSSTQLTVKFNTNPDTAMLVKIYTADDVLARTLFIGGTGKASTSLPAGTYTIKDGTGKEWYGEEEAFGEDGYYEIMTFGDGEQKVKLMKNYSSTITVNVQEDNPNADRVGSDYENWGSF